MRFPFVSGAIALSVLGCGSRPDPVVVCHNSHCTGPSDPAKDDSLDSLRASLALRTGDRPTVDGVEIDTFWSAADDKCLFTHDLETTNSAPPASEAVGEVVKHLETVKPATFRSDRFLVFFEMKPETSPPPKQPHTPEQTAKHADCVLDLIDTLDAAAARSGTNVEVTVTSFEHSLLEAVQARPRWRGKRDGERLQIRFGAILGVPPPLSATSQPFGTFGKYVDVAEVHPQWMTDGEREAYRSMGLKLGFWLFSVVPESLAAIEQDQPEIVVTSEAPLLRGWLSDR